MTRRAAAHDYTHSGIYHITIHVAEGLGQPLGAVVGNPLAPDGSADAPRTALSAAGLMVEHELFTAIHSRYPMVTIQDYVIMPDHLHFLLVVQDLILSQNGKRQPLGQVIAGFKKGCNRKYWEMLDAASGITQAQREGQREAQREGQREAQKEGQREGNGQTVTHTTGSVPSGSTDTAGISSCSTISSAGSVSSGSTAGKKVPSSGTTGRQPLFAPGFCDVMPVDERQLATQRAYIAGNPRSRLLRCTTPALHIQRGGITTALAPSALRGYLQRECPPSIATTEALAAIESRLLINTGSASSETPSAAGSASAPASAASSGTPSAAGSASAPASAASSGTPSAAGSASSALTGSVSGGFPAGKNRFIACDTYGDRSLLTTRRCLPVVCHRNDAKRFGEQKARCLEEAARGTTLVSARIARGEQEIIDEAVTHGFAVVLIHDNGFPDRYHPSADRLQLCAAGRLLLITPWSYQYRPKNTGITVPECKTMNCVAQALCRTKDNWWKNKE